MSFNTHWSGKSIALIIWTLAILLGWNGTTYSNPVQPQQETSEQTKSLGGGSHPQLPESRLQGKATMRYWGMEIYHARLWTLPSFSVGIAGDQPVVLELEYLRSLNGNAIAERSLKEMLRAAAVSDSQAKKWLDEMKAIFPDVKSGDRLTGQHIPGQGAVFWYNGRQIGQIDDADFARLFFGIWLSPNTSEPEMRMALLGRGMID